MRTLVLLLMLAGCAATGPRAGAPGPGGDRAAGAALPRSAILYRDTVTVHFPDGRFCAAVRPPGAAAWSGRLSGCPWTYPYRAALPAGPRPPRQVLRPQGTGPGVIEITPGGAFGLPPRPAG